MAPVGPVPRRPPVGDGGNAWDFFPHEHARSRAYRWGEDGLGGISDHWQHLCFGLTLWNTNDKILKERLFGLTNSEGNHGEDAKEYWWALDSTPTHSFMRWLYKYPHREFPYAQLLDANRGRSRDVDEFELVDTGVFDESRYFDVELTYAKAAPDDICIRLGVRNAGREAAELHVLPTLWFRNRWSWTEGAVRPRLRAARLRQRHQSGPPLRHRGARVPEGRHQRPRDRRRAHREPRRDGHKGRALVPAAG